jgi:membrane-associated HD superfamily phosphohydrolase
MAALALGVFIVLDWSSVGSLARYSVDSTWSRSPALGLLALLALGLISESRTLTINVVKSAGSTSSIIFLPLLVSIVLFGPTPTVVFITVTGVVGEFLIRRKEFIRAVFNCSQYIVSTFLAGLVYLSLNGQALGLESWERTWGVTQTVAFFLFGIVFLVLNHGAVSLAIALNEGVRLRNAWLGLVGRTGTNLFYDILLSPIAIAVAFLYLEIGVLGLFIIVLPLFFIREAFLTIIELQHANRDLLTALVKAMETRDPYTSGHSIRVSSLAGRISEGLGLSPNRQKDVETAAKLHDIGKIDAAYSEIIRKPEHLTKEEFAVIQSHSVRGFELLTELSSLSKNVLAGVRSHHERVDGKGYPDGLRGDEIPIEARIIKVCDAIDAMLSDRPYRRALTLEQVREQLVIYSGSQFDLEVVKAAIEGDLLETHQAEILLQKGQAAQEATPAKAGRESGRKPAHRGP